MAPSVTTGSPQPAFPLTSGAYLLTVSMGTSSSSGINLCTSVLVDGNPPPFGAVFVPAPVRVDRTGNSVSVTPEDPAATFRMQLQLAGTSVSGVASGSFQSSATTVTVSNFSNAPATATGVVGPASASGTLDGTVSVQGLSCTNNGHTWTLAPRAN
jgi:hypothetical protein